jgi:DNA-binding transcriptional regulator YhcF (GntR family)
MTTDRTADRALCRQVADYVRGQIEAGDYEPGDQLPSPRALARELGRADNGMHPDTVRHAYAILRSEGLIETAPRVGSHVRDDPRPRPVYVRPGDVITCRMPSEPQRRALGLPEGVPLLTVTSPASDPDTEPDVKCYPAHLHRLLIDVA